MYMIDYNEWPPAESVKSMTDIAKAGTGKNV